MAQAKRDENHVPTLIGASSADDQTPIRSWIDPTTHRLLVDAEIDTVVEVLLPSVDTGVYGSVSVGTSATLIVPANSSRVSVKISNNSTEILYIGLDSSVTTANGFQIKEDDVFQVSGQDLYKGAIYGIVATGTADVRHIDY